MSRPSSTPIALASTVLSFAISSTVLAQGTASQPAATPPASGASAPMAAPSGTDSVPRKDKKFLKRAAVGGMAEVELGQLAQQRGSSDSVKQFGQQMVQDHSKANDELKQIAMSKGVELPTSLDAKSQRTLAKLQKLSGAEFDKAYIDDMVSDHKDDIADFKKESRSGQDSDTKAFASKTLPTLESHLQMAEKAKQGT